MRILVADDDPTISQFICAVLSSAGHSPTPAFDGVSTMMAATRQPQPDLIVLDVRMPAGEGQTTLTKLKQLTKTATIPVVVCTALDDPSVRERMLAAGAAAFLKKPIDVDELIDTVNAALRGAIGR